MNRKLSYVFILVISMSLMVFAQQTKEKEKPGDAKTGGEPEFKPDSVIIFKSPRPLLTFQEQIKNQKYAWGGNLVFSESGFGGGLFLRRYLGEDSYFGLDLIFTESRNSDEFETPDYNYQRYLVMNKRNRLYAMPLTLGYTHYVFKNELFDSFAPFFTAGAGVAFIFKNPYFKDLDYYQYQDFFSAWKYTEVYTKFAGYVGIGAEFGKIGGSTSSVSIKYYFIPFGEPGLESMIYQDNSVDGILQPTGIKPMTQFGGVFINLSIGVKF